MVISTLGEFIWYDYIKKEQMCTRYLGFQELIIIIKTRTTQRRSRSGELGVCRIKQSWKGFGVADYCPETDHAAAWEQDDKQSDLLFVEHNRDCRRDSSEQEQATKTKRSQLVSVWVIL